MIFKDVIQLSHKGICPINFFKGFFLSTFLIFSKAVSILKLTSFWIKFTDLHLL